MDTKQFKKKPVMGIMRGIELKQLEPLIETSIAGGLETLEITMNTKDAPKLLRKASQISGKRLAIGAGTVLNMDDLKGALEAQATFIVMPVVVPEVLSYCVKNKIAVFPGALTPQEIYRAWNDGATMVKIFPVKFLGPQYLKEIKGPFADIELLACSGVTAQNMSEYFTCGASAVSFGSSVFKKDWLEKQDYLSIKSAIEAYTGQFPLPKNSCSN